MHDLGHDLHDLLRDVGDGLEEAPTFLDLTVVFGGSNEVEHGLEGDG